MTTDTWVVVIWSIGLAGALPLTLVILKEAHLVIRTLADIHRLALRTGEAARGISQNVAPVPTLPPALAGTTPLLNASAHLRDVAASFAKTVEAQFEPSVARRLGHWIVDWVSSRRQQE